MKVVFISISRFIYLLENERVLKKMKFKAISKNRDFKRGYKKGENHISSLVVLYVIKNRYNHLRIGVTASKKIGNAVRRNRARRLIKESVRLLNLNENLGYDLIFVARSKTTYSSMQNVKNEIEKHLKKAGIISEEI